jgi:two-component system, cell cycle sensor histidine kinase and response regulator CckA
MEINVEIPLNRGETILLVEDDPVIREMSLMMLQHLGYSILSAGTPHEAIRIVKENSAEIHLLITDVVMPEMNGGELADRLTEIRPEIKQIFMSGYTADIIAHEGILDNGGSFLQKPFSLQDLANRIREVLR